MFAHLPIAALNHLLNQNSWALRRLAHFSGKSAHFDMAPFSFACTILADGSLLETQIADNADAAFVLAPALIPRLALHDETAQAEIHSAGDPSLIEEILFLSRNLRWDAAEDLSHLTGDIAAERIVQTAQSMQHHLRDAAVNLAQAAAEYLTEENPMLAKPHPLSTFAQRVDELRDDVARLEQRIARLTGANKN